MDQYFELTSARIRPIKRIQFSVMSPDLIVSKMMMMVKDDDGHPPLFIWLSSST